MKHAIHIPMQTKAAELGDELKGTSIFLVGMFAIQNQACIYKEFLIANNLVP